MRPNYCGVNIHLAQCLYSVLIVKALVGTFNQEKAPTLRLWKPNVKPMDRHQHQSGDQEISSPRYQPGWGQTAGTWACKWRSHEAHSSPTSNPPPLTGCRSRWLSRPCRRRTAPGRRTPTSTEALPASNIMLTLRHCIYGWRDLAEVHAGAGVARSASVLCGVTLTAATRRLLGISPPHQRRAQPLSGNCSKSALTNWVDGQNWGLQSIFLVRRLGFISQSNWLFWQ